MEPSALVYDTAAAAEVWRRVAPAIPAYGAGVCPAGATCPLPRRETDGEAALGSLIADGAALYAACRRCAARSPHGARRVLEQLAREQQRTERSLLAASFLLRLLEKRLDGSDNYELVSTDSLAMSAGTYSHPSRKTPFDERSGEFGSGRPKGDY